MIDAEGQGRRFQEMHVDGGVTAPVLTLPDALMFRERTWLASGRMNIYILVNKKLEGNFELVSNSTHRRRLAQHLGDQRRRRPAP